MNYYETVYIVHPALQEGRLNDIVNKFHNKLEGFSGKVLYVNSWGKKKLAYPIDKQKYGTYILCQYSLNENTLKNISQELELNPNILRYLITKIDGSKILEGSDKLAIAENKTHDKIINESSKNKADEKDLKTSDADKEGTEEDEADKNTENKS